MDKPPFHVDDGAGRVREVAPQQCRHCPADVLKDTLPCSRRWSSARRTSRWSLAEEQTLLPALARLALAGRDPQHELRLEYAQIREITALLRRRLAEGLRPADLFGFADNLNVRLAAHEAGMEGVYYPAADAILLPPEREALERACPEP